MKTLNSQPGKDFMPTDDELLQKFLYNKINNEPIPNYLNILEHDLFGIEKTPLDIWNEFEASYSYGGKDLYFFTILKKKSPTSTRSVRTIANGNWEGEDTGKKIFAKGTYQLLGLKKRYRFERSNTPQDGGWILHEYNLHKSLINNTSANNYVLCRFRRNLKSESQNTQAKLSIGDQSNSHIRKISRTKNCSAPHNKEKPVIHKDGEHVIPKQEESLIPKQVKPIISDNKVWVKKYIIYEEALTQSNDGQSNDGGNKRKYEDDIEFIYKGKRSTLPEDKGFAELKALCECEYNNLFFGENIEQYLENRVDSRNSKTEVVGRTNETEWNVNKEDDDIIVNEEEEVEEEGEEEDDDIVLD